MLKIVINNFHYTQEPNHPEPYSFLSSLVSKKGWRWLIAWNTSNSEAETGNAIIRNCRNAGKHIQCYTRYKMRILIIIIIASFQLCWGRQHEFCFSILIYPKPKSSDNLHIFRSIFTTPIHVHFGVRPIPSPWAINLHRQIFPYNDAADLYRTCRNHIKRVSLILYLWHP